jgi:hypothetical protein
MTILSDYQKYKLQKQQIVDERTKRYKDNQFAKIESRTATQSGIINMSDALQKVRENKTTLNRDLCRLTSSGLNV